MAVSHRALLVWLLTLIFLILLAIHLDGGLEREWWALFSPLWLFDVVSLGLIVGRLYRHYRVGRLSGSAIAIGVDDLNFSPRQAYLAISMVMLKTTFQALLCLRMSGGGLALVWTMVPAWILLLGLLVDLTRRLRIIHSKPATA
uniref:Transmembrane protein 60 n=1 Tax=Plectus sambesii TaxID=2011161 RepID=A0A914UVG2_9BILA